MLILTQSQAKNYFNKLHNCSHNEGCGCCYSTQEYVIENRRILKHNYGEHQGTIYHNVTVIAKIKKARSN